MDPITLAIVTGIATGLATSAGDATLESLARGYRAFTSAIKARFGTESELARSIGGLEANPDSEARKALLHEEVVKAKADQDPELLKAAQELLEQLSAQPGGQQYIQNVQGNLNATVQGSGTASVHNYEPRPNPPQHS